jgi:acyl-CoA thioesterase-1
MRYGVQVKMRKVLAALFVKFMLLNVIAAPVWADQPVRIAAFGDSLIHGYGLWQGEGFVPQMQAWLDDQGVAATLVNAGVSGDTSAGGAARVAWTFEDNVQGMIVLLGGNDLLRGLDPAQTRANLTSILTQAQENDIRVLLVGMQAPGNYGPDYKEQFDVIYGELAEQFGVALYPWHFAAIAEYLNEPARLSEVMQPDNIHPNKAGVAAIVADMGPSVAALVAEIR